MLANCFTKEIVLLKNIVFFLFKKSFDTLCIDYNTSIRAFTEILIKFKNKINNV